MEEVDGIIAQCAPDALSKAVSKLFRRLLANILLNPDNPTFRAVRMNNAAVQSAVRGIPDSVVEALFSIIGFKLEHRSGSEPQYVFGGDPQGLGDSDRLLSYIEKSLDEAKLSSSQFRHPPISSRTGLERNERKDLLIREIRRNIAERGSESGAGAPVESQDVFCTDDFASVENLKDIAKRTLLNTGRIRNAFFGCRHFSLRRMTRGRVYVCKEGCPVNYLEAHWHLFTGKNMLYSYVAHLNEDGSSVAHLGVEHGYQYNSLPGTTNFRKTIHFSAKRTNEKNGRLDYLEHPNQPSKACVYCDVSFSQLFL